jgi:L-ascorbate metabolism protein UlaG (beta-lactamase superfamily)
VFSWLGHISGAVSMMGRVVLLDSYIPRLEVTPGRTPFVIKDIVDIKPEAIFIGHGHSDHADNAVFIAAKTGATLYMTPEACGTAQTALARMKADTFMQADPFYAIAAGDDGHLRADHDRRLDARAPRSSASTSSSRWSASTRSVPFTRCRFRPIRTGGRCRSSTRPIHAIRRCSRPACR